MYTYTYIKLQMRRDSANKNAEFSQLVLGMGCPQEQRLFINIYRCLQICRRFFFYYDVVVFIST